MIDYHKFELVNETLYSFDSTDNQRSYRNECHLERGSQATSVHGLLVNDEPILVVADSGGATAVHQHSSIRVGNVVYFAVGRHVCRFSPGATKLDWHLRVDDATCFGLHYSETHDALIAHGELTISRFTADGRLVWQCWGADIFTGRVALEADHVEAVDSQERLYRFSYDHAGQSDVEVGAQEEN